MTSARAKTSIEILAMVAPLLVFLFITISGLSIPGYNDVTQYVSILGSRISPIRDVFNIFGFGFFAIVIIALGFILSDYLRKNYYSKTATRLLMGSGVLLGLLGIFSTDPTYDAVTFEGKIHSLIGKIVFLMVPLSMVWFGLAFDKEEEWGAVWAYGSYFLAAVAFVATLALGLFPHAMSGIVERVGMGADLLWMALVSLNMFLLDGEFRFQKWLSKINVPV